MSFLYTIFLPALAAAAIPVLLHFFSRQRLPLIDFSSLEFLKKLQKQQARRVQIRQIILLILRTLAVAALVMAFARPALNTHGSGGGSASSTEMVIIFDDAISSAAETRNGNILQLEQDYVSEFVKLIGQNDRVTLLAASGLERSVTRSGTEALTIPIELAGWSSRQFRPSVSFAFAQADSIFRASTRFNRELVIISPFYNGGIDSVTIPEFEGVRNFLVPVGPEAVPNVSIEKVRLVSAIRQKGRPVELETTIQNYGNNDLEAVPVSVYIGAERVAQGSVDLPASGSVVKTFVFSIGESGLLSGSVRLDDVDGLKADNRRYFVMDVPEKLNLLVVAADSLELKILRSVFSSGPSNYFDLALRLPGNWETEPLAKYDAIILADLPMISGGAVQRVNEFLLNGGGVILMPGPSSDLADWSRGLLAKTGFKPIGEVIKGGVTWGKFDSSHPLFFGVFEESGSPSLPNLSFAINLTPGPGDLSIVPLASGGAFLIERQIGKGRALLFASPPSPASGEFIFSGIFAPLLFRAGAYVSGGNSSVEESWEVGTTQTPVIFTPDIVELNQVNPLGETIARQPRAVIGGVEYQAGMILDPGVYRFENTTGPVAKYAANLSSGIGLLMRSDLKNSREKFKDGNILDVPKEQIGPQVSSLRYGRELWRPIAAMFLGLLVAESIVGRARKSESE